MFTNNAMFPVLLLGTNRQLLKFINSCVLASVQV